ncbi:relaxase/mobilization nuclease domain-containing protein (plasmid) [Hymenobacter sp. 5516J-16]|uniref:relaxase/mobilization nuclease domain-containing protein n=1 Tax=Hymenobacter sp. 5516J-16 TaxID=2932253 RepID=UPI001FD19677|nr:relaxase/mobilization nuclease domain-containing protein [Hymenobacter sp. 5516J-16]UOQ79213.1 relaxase/mobilization nuclease domain-containing protein [Hymenobacter sp. 5516J-16]
MKVNQSFGAMCRYVLQEKTPDKGAEVLAAHGVRTDNAAHMAADFDAVRAMRPTLGKAVLHVALAFPAEEKEKVTPEVMGRIAQDYLKGLQIDPENTQWAVVRHQDKAHPHMHLVVNRVDLDGQTVSDQFIRSRSVDVCKGIEQQYGLIVADQVGRKQAREIGPTPAQAKATTPKEQQSAEWSRARQEIGRALSYTAGQARSFEELREALRARGIGLELTRRKDGSPAGVVFEQDGHRVKGSQVGREYSAGNLETGFAKVRELGQEPAQALQQVGQDYALAKLAAEYAQAKQRQQPERTPGQEQSRGLGIGD